MQAIILAGGLGTRISEETHTKPKPMIEIGGKPILWHIMKKYSSHGINDFIICCGYKGYVIKEYFSNYYLHNSDVTFNLGSNELQIHSNNTEPWSVTLVDTGEFSQTGGRLANVRSFVRQESFCFTYGDGLSDVDIATVVHQHLASNTIATLTAVQPPGRFGSLIINENSVSQFQEKPAGDNAWINGGFFVLKPEIFNYITGADDSFENDVLPRVAAEGQLTAYRHHGFWQPMDTLRDKTKLEEMWQTDSAPWKSWN